MKKWVFDIESYKNLFTITFVDYDSSETVVFEISETKNQLKELLEFIKTQGTFFLIGFNSIHYDEALLGLLMYDKTCRKLNSEDLCLKINELSNRIIQENARNPFKYRRKPWISIDLMLYWSQLIRKNSKISLKGLASHIGWPLIQELPIAPEKRVEKDQIEIILRYNLNDVLVTKKLAHLMKDRINLRKQIVSRFHINAWSMDDVKIGMEILLKEYCKLTGEEPEHIIPLRSPRKDAYLKEHIFPEINFKTPHLQELLEDFKDSHVVFGDKKSKFTGVGQIGDMKLQFGMGGIHSKDKPAMIKPPKGWKLIASDVASYYPNMLISWGLYPEHLGPAFITVYEEVKNTRAKAKKDKDEVINKGFKLALNGFTGNLRNKYSWGQDEWANIGITVNGQLFLAMLAERAHLAGYKVISMNTDGIEVMIPEEKEAEYLKLCKKWETIAKVELEHEEYQWIARTSVSDYLALKSDNTVKRKGDFVIDPVKETPNQQASGHDELIVPKALNHFLVEGGDWKEYIMNCDDLTQFTATPKIEKKFTLYWGGEPIQRLSRHYVSKLGKPLYKKKVEDGEERIMSIKKDWDVEIANDLPPFMPADIEYDYYFERVQKILDSMQEIY